MKKHLCILLLLFLCFSETLNAQQKIITGRVADQANLPIAGATIVIKSTTTGVSTDFDGNFKIKASIGDLLIVSSLGFLNKEITVGNQNNIAVTLIENLNQLSEVVVVAYGTQKKETVTSSLVSIEAESLKDLSTPEVSSMLQGKAAGVQVAASSGAPGSTPSVLIRGFASLNGSVEPLWVVDGVIQHSVPIINPADVANISVLKDASATALYGSRGANGVIVVSTKRAKKGTKPQLQLNLKTAINIFNTGNFKVMNSEQLYNYHLLFSNSNPWFTEQLLERNTNWLDIGTKDAFLKDLNTSFNVSTENLNWYLNAGLYSEEGTLRGNELNRYTFRTNLDYKISKRLTVKPKISFSFDNRDKVAEAPLYELFLNLPWDLPYNNNGVPVNALESSDWIGRDKRNYLFDQQWNYSEFNIFNMSGNFDFEFKILPNLSYISTNNFTFFRSLSKSYIDPRSNAGKADIGSISGFSADRLTRFNTQMLKYSNVFNSLHTVNILGAYEYNDYTYQDIGATGKGIIPNTEIIEVTSKPGSVSGNKNDYALQSLFLATDYDFNNKYFAKASIRRDGASNFGLNNKYGNFFSLGVGWNIHREEFFKSSLIDQLKLRLSYGSVGNRPSSLYPYQNTYRVNTQYIGIPGAILAQFGNSDLEWEKSYEANFALDARIFNRLNITLEYYNKNTSDLLYFVSLPDITAFSGYWENVGGLKNTGFEAVIAADIVRNNDISFNIGFNIGINKNQITSLFEGANEIPFDTRIFKVGEDANTWYIRKWLGVNPDNGEPQWEVIDPSTAEKSKTSNWNNATLQPLGTSTPDFIGGFNTNFTYKSFSVTSNFSFSKGGTIYNSSREFFDSDGSYPTFNQMLLTNGWTRWQNPGDIASHPQAILGGNNNSNKRSSRYLEDGSYLRLNNISLLYNLPDALLSRIKLKGLSLYLSGDNLITWTKFSGTDPAIGGLGGDISLGYPLPKRYALGLNVIF
ncbi:MAG: SusC/RagA family TonB-linked outer membrane protein [Tenacibaculum sp.]